MNELISIVVPIYNVENYLEECINSLLKQTYTNIEILLIDDGSPDNSGLICDKYSLIDNRIKVYHKENGGLSDARNYGTDKCSGNYIIYIDSDDFVDKDLIKILYEEIKKNDADVAISCHDETGKNIDKNILNGKVNVGSGDEILYYMLKDFSWPAWGKLFSKDIIHNYKFKKGILYEDFELIPKIMMDVSKAVLIRKPLYHYRIRNDSIMGVSKKGYTCDYMNIAFEHAERLKNTNEKFSNVIPQFYRRVYRDLNKQYDKKGKIKNKQFANLMKIFARKNFDVIAQSDQLDVKYKIGYFMISISPYYYGKILRIIKR